MPGVVDFWAAWCRPCRKLGPVIERCVEARAGKVELAKVDVGADQDLARSHRIQSIPAVKALRDGVLADEFVGAQPPATIERFLDGLLPSEADGLIARGDEASLQPSRADAAVPLARILHQRGELDDALQLLACVPGIAADGLTARIGLQRAAAAPGGRQIPGLDDALDAAGSPRRSTESYRDRLS